MDLNNTFWFENVEMRAHPWPGLNWVTTMLSVPDVKHARDLYMAAFNFVPIFDSTNQDGVFVTTRMRYRGANFVLVKEDLDFDGCAPSVSGAQSPFYFYVYVDNCESSYEQAIKLGFTTFIEPSDTPWGDRRCRLKCPFGYVWDLAHRI